ncbi:IclR family transcriptional regulator [Brachybacterium sp. DNPG3]
MPGPTDPVPEVRRALEVLDLLADASARPTPTTEIADALGIAAEDADALCAVLEDGRMIRRTDGGYRLGMRTAELGGRFSSQFHQVREFFPAVEQEEDLAGELVQIAARDDLDTLYLVRYEGREHRLGSPLGARLPLVLTATGLAMLSALPDDAIEDVLARTEIPALTSRSDSTATQIRARVAEARERGFAIDDGRSTAGITGIAAPLPPWHPSDPLLAVGSALPSAELDPERTARIGAAVQRVAAALTHPLGRDLSGR